VSLHPWRLYPALHACGLIDRWTPTAAPVTERRIMLIAAGAVNRLLGLAAILNTDEKCSH
jgi:hypothetical protein